MHNSAVGKAFHPKLVRFAHLRFLDGASSSTEAGKLVAIDGSTYGLGLVE